MARTPSVKPCLEWERENSLQGSLCRNHAIGRISDLSWASTFEA